MFGKLKQKLKEFTDSVSKKVDEKAVVSQDTVETETDFLQKSDEDIVSNAPVPSDGLPNGHVPDEEVLVLNHEENNEDAVKVADSDGFFSEPVSSPIPEQNVSEDQIYDEKLTDGKNETFVSKFKTFFTGKKASPKDSVDNGNGEIKYKSEGDSTSSAHVLKETNAQKTAQEDPFVFEHPNDGVFDSDIVDREISHSVAANPDDSETETVIESREQKRNKKPSFIQKASSLLFNREIILDENDLEEPLFKLEMALLESDLALSVTEAIIESVREELVGSHKKIGKNTSEFIEEALKNALLKVMSANVFDFDAYIREKKGKTIHLAFIGINGTGKTTSIAKMAYRLKNQGYSVVIAAGDTFRAGAIDQIQIHADRLGVKVIRHQEGSDPAAVVYDALQYAKAHNIDVLLSDTAGRMHTNVNLMAQLEKICRVSSPDLILFVDESTAGNDAVERASQFGSAVEIDGSILTKLDADSKGGAAISIAYITQKPILFFGVGQGYEDLMKFDADWFVNKLFEE